MPAVSRPIAIARLAAVLLLVAGCVVPERSGGPSPSAVLGATGSPATSSNPSSTESTPGADAVEVNSTVVDRSGVVADLHDRFWWTDTEAGQVGTTAEMRVPTGEHVVFAGNGIGISARRSADDPFRGPLDLVAREIGTGAVLREISTSLTDVDAVLVGRQLFWTGLILGGQDDGHDGGVWAADLDSDETPKAIVAAGARLSTQLSGRHLEISATRQTIGAILAEAVGPGSTDVIDVASLTRRSRLGAGAVAITDDLYVTSDQGPTDAPYWGYGITARSLSSSAVRWRYPAADQVDRFVLRDAYALGSAIVIQYEWRTGDALERITARLDPRTGKATILLREDDPGSVEPLTVQASMSSGQHLVLTRNYDLGEVLAAGPAAISTLELGSGRLTEPAFEIQALFQ
jgi:hypothetical protein